MKIVQGIFFGSVFCLFFNSCDLSDLPDIILGDSYVRFTANGDYNELNSVFAEFQENVLTVTANALGGGFESNSVAFHVKTDGPGEIVLDMGSEDEGDVNFFTFTISNTIAYETGEGVSINFQVVEFDEDEKFFSGTFAGEVAETDDASDKISITEGEFLVHYQ